MELCIKVTSVPGGVRAHHGNCYSLHGAHHGLFRARAFITFTIFHIVAKKPFSQCSGSFKHIKRPVPCLC